MNHNGLATFIIVFLAVFSTWEVIPLKPQSRRKYKWQKEVRSIQKLLSLVERSKAILSRLKQ